VCALWSAAYECYFPLSRLLVSFVNGNCCFNEQHNLQIALFIVIFLFSFASARFVLRKFTICVSHLHCSYGSPIFEWLDPKNFVVEGTGCKIIK
jgi:hypothetical protein